MQVGTDTMQCIRNSVPSMTNIRLQKDLTEHHPELKRRRSAIAESPDLDVVDLRVPVALVPANGVITGQLALLRLGSGLCLSPSSDD